MGWQWDRWDLPEQADGRSHSWWWQPFAATADLRRLCSWCCGYVEARLAQLPIAPRAGRVHPTIVCISAPRVKASKLPYMRTCSVSSWPSTVR